MTLIQSPIGSAGHSLALTLREAKLKGHRHISIPKDTYHVYSDEAAVAVACVSNHGHNGYKSAAMVIEDFDGLTVDGNGSKFILHGCMDFAIIKNSKSVTIKNLTVTCADSCNFQGKVTRSDGNCVTVELQSPPPLLLHGDLLCQNIEHTLEPMGRTINYNTDTGEIRKGTGDENFGVPFQSLKKELDGNTLRIYDAPVMPPVNDTVVFTMSRRCNQAFLMSNSTDTTIENVTVNTCWGMAFIAQKCTNVTIRLCSVTPEKGRFWSAGQDATHFVNCRGTVRIEDCLFENQLDDSVNLHGTYTVIEKVSKNKLLLRYGHYQTRGIDVYGIGDVIQIQKRDTQQPVGAATVTEVDVLNPDLTLITLSDIQGQIEEGMIVENLSDEADAIIKNNVIRNNRARGMLIATKGKIEIIGNRYHCAGAAIQFESDPIKWLECGGVKDVVIENNLFDDCRHGAWGSAVIDICPRVATAEGFFYHEKITVRNNKFTQKDVPCVNVNSVHELIFSDNEYVCDQPIISTGK